MAQDTGEYAHVLQVWLCWQSEHALFNGYSKYLNRLNMKFRYYVHSDWLKKHALQSITPRSFMSSIVCFEN